MQIQVNNISKIYGAGESKVTALKAASMTIFEGDFISIMGPSGSGKSTLLHIISGLDNPTSGTVLMTILIFIMAVIRCYQLFGEKKLVSFFNNSICFPF